ncbi:lipopolysaccharide assembly protein LapB [Methylobacillus sp. MM3]|uniref:lipopolysaccharide assembly protein LapB n=1 Tax=Methylobacillus sp. MM3 TaxID=1848039 RepID=UPI0007E245BB|nr:lipopolysaccharide assembly protein LapB [Methylobacillus sp. MM3]OAJ70906.1 lipopolysaccharide assembly protein LapB [Methylobacillus sp. MM3]
MEFEYWWLLALPLFFLLGWLAARMDLKQLLTESSAMPAAYFKGLNFLIKEQHDKAIEAFIEAVQINSESLELHFALGSLFRLRGEIDRAIHLHTNLLERPQLSDIQRFAIMAELAQDYLKAGLFDRAEELFRALCASPTYHQPALRSLLDIYIRERDWLRAIETATELERASGVRFHKEIAQFHCELAVEAASAVGTDQARKYLAEALAANPECVRATIMLGDMEAAAGSRLEAIVTWKRVEQQKPQYLGLVASRLLENYTAQRKTGEGLELLKVWMEKYSLPSILNIIYEATLKHEGADAAAKLARTELVRKPSLNILDRLLQAREIEKSGEESDVGLIKNTVHHFLGNTRSYCCSQCGFRARQYYWQCPGCNHWESFPPEPKEQPLR